MESLKDLPFNVVDLIVLAVLLISAVFAYMRGFIHEVLAIGGWIGAIFATLYGYPYLQPYIRDLVPIQLAADLATGVSIFVLSLAVLSVLTRGITRHIQESSLNVLDRSVGFLFGLARGAVLLCLTYIGLELLTTRADQPDWLREAKSMPLIVEGSDWLRTLVPDDLNQVLPDTGARISPQGIELDPERVVRGLISPEVEAPKPPLESEGAYEDQQRKQLDRLIENSAGQ